MNPIAFFPAFAIAILAAVLYLLWIERREVAAWLFEVLFDRVACARNPDYVVVGQAGSTPYLHRWYLVPRNRWLNVYLHCFLRDDDDRALHDHPWASLSFMLAGRYIEHTIKPGGVHAREQITAGTLRFRLARHAHRIELKRTQVKSARSGEVELRPEQCWTLFITGPTVRTWGFHCPDQGWIPWSRFTTPGKPGETGPGCEG